MTFLIPRLRDIIDILVIAFVIYQSLLIVRKSGAYQVLYGIVFLFVVYLLAVLFELKMVSSILNVLSRYWILALIILFHPELRAILARLSITEELGKPFRKKEHNSFYGALIDAISSMAFRRTGALIVIENKRKLNEYIISGEAVDALISLRLILSIFNTRSVLHDGAIVIRKDRIIAAKVVLPLSKNPDHVNKYGTRHLAGIGITEVSDAIAIIVSEQTGKTSVAQAGTIHSGIAFEELM
ncbi:MAG: diadenylate cyclase CdaA, partial [Candidatus Cloacimonadaceae bacterium]|nr:diadenylate cyclase CdaA [Candidatus Cloacimonadaceae bacterium]